MAMLLNLVIIICIGIIAYVINERVVNVVYDKPVFPLDGYFGPGAKHEDNEKIEQFKVSVKTSHFKFNK
jgi:hypothetical protein